MKKILLTIYGLSFHKNEGAKNRLNSFIDSYVAEGYEVHVLLFYSLTSFPYIFKKNKYLSKRAKWYLFPSLPISYHKLLTKISMFINQLLLGVFTHLKSYEIIQAEVTGIVGRWAPRHSLFITDFHGDSVSETKFRNENTSNWLSQFILTRQRSSLEYSDHIIVVSENLRKQLEKNTDKKINNYSIISCGVDIDRFNEAEVNCQENEKDRIVIGYLGGFQKWQNISAILSITKQLRGLDDNIFLKLFSNGDPSPYQRQLDEIGQENYECRSLSFDDVPSQLQTLDAGFLIRDNLPLNIVSSPTKIAEYLAAGVPVICTRYSGDYGRSIEHKVQGFILDEKQVNDEQLYNLYSYLTTVKRNRAEIRKKCIEEAEKKAWIREFRTLNKIIN